MLVLTKRNLWVPVHCNNQSQDWRRFGGGVERHCTCYRWGKLRVYRYEGVLAVPVYPTGEDMLQTTHSLWKWRRNLEGKQKMYIYVAEKRSWEFWIFNIESCVVMMFWWSLYLECCTRRVIAKLIVCVHSPFAVRPKKISETLIDFAFKNK